MQVLHLLKVFNFALIEQAEIEFSDGFNVLTGETGAGKSIVVDALSVVLGGRSSVDMIRGGSEQFRVEAVFELQPHSPMLALLEEQAIPLEEDGRLFISRSVSRQAKNTVLINGTHAPLSLLRAMGDLLLDMHGQHENQALLRPESYLALLDDSDGTIAPVLACYQKSYEVWREIQSTIAAVDRNDRQRAQRLDLLQWQTNEIEAARLKEAEEIELPQQISLLAHAEKISASVGSAWAALSDSEDQSKGVIDMLKECRRHLESAARFDPVLNKHADELSQILVQLDELAPELRNYLEQVEVDPDRLARLQDRMDQIYRLKQKYGASVTEVFEYAQNAKNEMEELIRHDEVLQQLQNQLVRQEQELAAQAAKLGEKRVTAASVMARLVESQLQDLGMSGGRFRIIVDSAAQYSSVGRDSVRFEFSANPGEELRPLAKVASGGELSRVALAIKTVCSRNNGAQVMVFDEIDAGVGGHTARKVAEKIAHVAGAKQVLCITHLPQIASMADRHVHLEKKMVGDRTQTFVRVLPEAERLHELARMIGGDPITSTGLDNAAEMIRTAGVFKSTIQLSLQKLS